MHVNCARQPLDAQYNDKNLIETVQEIGNLNDESEISTDEENEFLENKINTDTNETTPKGNATEKTSRQQIEPKHADNTNHIMTGNEHPNQLIHCTIK